MKGAKRAIGSRNGPKGPVTKQNSFRIRTTTLEMAPFQRSRRASLLDGGRRGLVQRCPSSNVSPHGTMPSFPASAPLFAASCRPPMSAPSPIARLPAAPPKRGLGSSRLPCMPVPHRIGTRLVRRTRQGRALHGNALGHRASEGQSVDRASRGSAAPGSQSIEVLGPSATERGCGDGGVWLTFVVQSASSPSGIGARRRRSLVNEHLWSGTQSTLVAVRANQAFKRSPNGRPGQACWLAYARPGLPLVPA